MARAISTDPHMNFRFGVRHKRGEPWLGFCTVSITPDKAGNGPGTIEFSKHYGEELIAFMNNPSTTLNIGIGHISEERNCLDPKSQIDLYGVVPKDCRMMGPIKLDAKGGQEEVGTSVLIVHTSMRYERAVFYPKSDERLSRAKARRPIVM